MSTIQTFDKLRADITLKLNPHLTIKVQDKDGLAVAQAAGREAKDFAKRIEEVRTSLVKPLNDKVKEINEYAKSILGPVLQVEGHIKKELIAFENILAKERAAEQEKLEAERQEKLKASAEKERVERENRELAAAFGEVDESAQKRQELIAKAEQEREAAESERLERENQKNIAANKVSGARKVWKHEVMDEELVPRRFLVVDETLIRKAIAAGEREIAGVKIYQDTQISIR